MEAPTIHLDIDKLFNYAERPIEDYNSGLCYLASPYSHPDREVMDKRLDEITKITARLTERFGRDGMMVFSPIVYTAQLEKICDPPQGWYYADFQILSRCDRLLVIQMDGWQESKGIQLEIAFALGKGIPVKYMSPEVALL